MQQINDEKINKAKAWYTKNLSNYDTCTTEISKLIEKILNHHHISYHSISHRVKSEESFLNKCKKEIYDAPEEQITDVVGIRVISYTNREVRQICEVIKKEFEIDINNSGNKADKLEDNKVGYLSVHFIAKLNKSRKRLTEYSEIKDVKFEIQIRTLLQHTWAEIEHDKSYKFSGELRKDLKRRFYLIAGVLELMDQEFENLSDEIDMYAEDVNKKTKVGDFDITIDSTSIIEYMKNKYIKLKLVDCIESDLVEELKDYGLTTLQDIENIKINEHSSNPIRTYRGMLRHIMIVNNADKYFKEAYKNRWGMINSTTIEYLESYGVDIKQYMKKYGIVERDYEE